MPTTKTKNILYRLALPVLAPAVSSDPLAFSSGHIIHTVSELNHLIRKNHISGGAFFFQHGAKCAEAFSHAFHTEKIPDRNTYYRVASITKMATALVAVRLMDQGIVDPLCPVEEILSPRSSIPELKGVTIQHLLSHTSGLSDPPMLEKLTNQHLPFSQVVAGCRFQEPGKVFRYSNLGFGLLGCLFECLLNESVEKIFRRFLFDPLHMNATLEAASVPEDMIMPIVRILPYHKENLVIKTTLGSIPINRPDPDYHYGYTAGSLYSDLPSLAGLLTCIRDHGTPLLSEQYGNYMLMQSASYGSLSPTLSYGHGLLIIRDPRLSAGPVFGHQGFAYGCVDGAFWNDDTGDLMISLNGGCSEARIGRLGIANFRMCQWAFRKELPLWK